MIIFENILTVIISVIYANVFKKTKNIYSSIYIEKIQYKSKISKIFKDWGCLGCLVFLHFVVNWGVRRLFRFCEFC